MESMVVVSVVVVICGWLEVLAMVVGCHGRGALAEDEAERKKKRVLSYDNYNLH